MSDLARQSLMMIVGSGALLVLIIFVVIFLSQRKKNKVDVPQVESPDRADPFFSAPVDRIEPKEIRSEIDAEFKNELERKKDLEIVIPLSEKLRATEETIFGRIRNLFSSSVEENIIDEIEEILYTSDLGSSTVERLMEHIKSELGRGDRRNIESVKKALREEILSIFPSDVPRLNLENKTNILMIVGINGAGKTTTIGKLAAQFAQQGKKVLVAAGDTFRAAADAQLREWTSRAQVEIFSPEGVKDPSAVAFDAVAKGVAQEYEIVIVDTAGRLHTQNNLMEELKKMKRVLTKVLPEAPHETLLVLDANNGQNALQQAREFHKAIGITGVILTKMDGTAKGGVAIAISNELSLPIRFIGVGEKITDLRAFSRDEFVESIVPS